jgi:catechol 2,3-dioxygenase-like lactoylglutathione lyase family enzyme
MKSDEALIRGASPTVYVSDLETSVTFYTETLGLKLMYQAPGEFAMIDAGDGTSIGLHPRSDRSPEPGPGASIQIGLGVCRPIQEVVDTLQARGVKFRGPVVNDAPVKIAPFGDPDGNDLYLCEFQH